MHWQEARATFPDKWLLVEAIRARSEENRRVVEDLAIVDTYENSGVAWQSYVALQRQDRQRELYVFHSSRESLEIEERRWIEPRPSSWWTEEPVQD
jgi:hypothetical protein